MNKQEIFDTVATHMFTQGTRSILWEHASGSICAYRSENGMSCAVGCVIPDEYYSPEMEKIPFTHKFVKFFPLPKWMQDEDNQYLLRNLQFVHDAKASWESTDIMRSSLANVAMMNRINSDILQTLSFKRQVNPCTLKKSLTR